MLLVSVLIPTYNHLPLLKICLTSVLNQSISSSHYEVVVLDDGSTDGTWEWLIAQRFENTRPIRHQQNQGRVSARNRCVEEAQAELIIFIDSDVMVTPTFIEEHLKTHQENGPAIICQGALIREEIPNYKIWQKENHFQTIKKSIWTDCSRAFFATGNVSVNRTAILQAGGFDERFNQYGWEDLELGIRLKQFGIRVIRNHRALGFHLEPSLTLANLTQMGYKEFERGKGAWQFFRKHPTLEVRLMTQITPFHFILNDLITCGGYLNVQRAFPFLKWLSDRGYRNLAIAMARALLNHYNIQALKTEQSDI